MQQFVDIGLAPNDGLGDPLRTAMDKVNDNTTELYNAAVEPLEFYFQGRSFRFAIRAGKLCVDQILTPLGFDVGGIEDTNWKKVIDFAL